MKHLSKIMWGLLCCVSVAFGQSKNSGCGCPENQYSETKADTVFYLPNGKAIALCGYRDMKTIKGKTLYSEFVLAACGDKKIIGFWGALQSCKLSVVKNTLLVETLSDLPVGKNMNYKKIVWTTEHIYFVNGNLTRNLVVNNSLPRYTPQQIKSVLTAYQQAPDRNTEYTDKIADKLFISAISGSTQARADLNGFKKKFTKLDGAYSEGYSEIMRMLKLWDQQHHI